MSADIGSSVSPRYERRMDGRPRRGSTPGRFSDTHPRPRPRPERVIRSRGRAFPVPTTFRITNELTGVREDVTHYFPEETAAEFGLSTRTVVRRISSGQWHGVRIG